MGINRKIEAIRQKPEHIRIRYVWGSVAVSMAVVVLIWVVSLKVNFKAVQIPKVEDNPLSQSWEDIERGQESIKSLMQESVPAMEEGLMEGTTDQADDQDTIIAPPEIKDNAPDKSLPAEKTTEVQNKPKP